MHTPELLRRTLLVLLAAMTPLLAGHAARAQSAPQVEDLRCEYLVDPLGIDVEKPRLSWVLPPGPRGRRQQAYRVLVASSAEALAKHRGDLWDSGKVTSDQSTWVAYAGRPLASGEPCHWKVRVWDSKGLDYGWSRAGKWSMGLLRESDWHGRWIGQERPEDVKEGTPLPFPWLRKTFRLAGKSARAMAYVNSLGYYELYINGNKVDDQNVLSPAPSDFSRRSVYVTHDVTSYLLPGNNVVALWLGRGWYVRGHPGVVHDGPLVRAQLDISVPGGAPGESTVRIATDESWKAHASPIRPLGRGLAFGDYGGEHYDARLELPAWNSLTLDDSGWKPAARFDPAKVPAVAQMVEPNRIIETLKPVRVSESAPGVHMIEMGRNFTGWLELRLPRALPAGKLIKLEYLDFPPPAPGVRWLTHNQRDEVVTRGGVEQRFRSRFNYHGFGWVRVTGLEQAPSTEDAKGYLIHTDYAPAASFECSNDLLNRIHRLTTWTYKSLTLGGYVVDCPTRERLGYGGDAGTSHETGMFNFRSGGLYNRWLGDWRAAQHPDTGDLPYTAPHYPNQGGGGPMWSGFVVTLPWQMYLHYGDRRALETNYPLMRRWLAFLETKTVDHVLERYVSYGISALPQWNFLGDWVPPKPAGGVNPPFGDPQSAKFINNCHYLYQLQLAARIAKTLGKPDDAAGYEVRAAALTRALHERFYKPQAHSYVTGEQPYLGVPLLFGVVPPELRGPVFANLEQTIRVKDRGHINAGMHGTYFLLKYLMEQDRNDLIYGMVSKREFPGWGYMLDQGATTAWEDWEGNNSRIHDTLISVGSWFIQGVGGIRIDEQSPGFKHVVIKPAAVGDLTFARTRYRSPYGQIVSDWRREGDLFHLDVTVPPGATATVHLPPSAPDSVREGGRAVGQTGDVRAAGVENGRPAYRVQSGQYAFTCRPRR